MTSPGHAGARTQLAWLLRVAVAGALVGHGAYGALLGRPSWFGSWMIMPIAYGQLLHAFVFDRDCFPESFGGFILKRSPEYIQERPVGLATSNKWPSTFDIVDGLAEISRQHWP